MYCAEVFGVETGAFSTKAPQCIILTTANLSVRMQVDRDSVAYSPTFYSSATSRKTSASNRMRQRATLRFNRRMYCTDFVTGETLFQFPAPDTARSVVLETFANRKRLRVRMQRCANDWIAKLKLPSGWCFYRFEVDGKVQWDRHAGKMKTQDGRPCSLAVISTGSAKETQSLN
jgi:hypothetical protein